jgi:hypothetical protein
VFFLALPLSGLLTDSDGTIAYVCLYSGCIPSFLIRSDTTLRSIRLSGPIAVILVVSHASGCGPAPNVYLPPGTAVVVQSPDAKRVVARVPVEDRAIVKRRSLAITNNTAVTIVDDPAYPALPTGSTSSQSPFDPVRVRITAGVNQGIEVIVRRQDISLPIEPSENVSVFLPIAVLVLVAAAAALWSIETLVLLRKNRREVHRDKLTMYSSARVRSCTPTPKQKTRITDRGDRECDNWLGTVAAMTARRKVRCTTSCRRSAATSH